jgi:hypothetical protein
VVDIEPIDLVYFGDADTHRKRPLVNFSGKSASVADTKAFGIIDSQKENFWGENHRRSDNWACKGSNASFVHTCHAGDTRCPKRPFEGEHAVKAPALFHALIPAAHDPTVDLPNSQSRVASHLPKNIIGAGPAFRQIPFMELPNRIA